jgi:hypothetical protein
VDGIGGVAARFRSVARRFGVVDDAIVGRFE